MLSGLQIRCSTLTESLNNSHSKVPECVLSLATVLGINAEISKVSPGLENSILLAHRLDVPKITLETGLTFVSELDLNEIT